MALFPGVGGRVKGEIPTFSTYTIVVEDADR
jgi:hypothetical protein